MQDLNAANDWLYEEGFEGTAKEFNEKIHQLNKTAGPIFVRHNEFVNRPAAIEYLLQGLNYTNYFLTKVANTTVNV